MSQRLVKRLYNIKEAAMYLGRTQWGIREMVYAGKIPYVKDVADGNKQGRVFLDISDMDEWIDRNKTQFTY